MHTSDEHIHTETQAALRDFFAEETSLLVFADDDWGFLHAVKRAVEQAEAAKSPEGYSDIVYNKDGKDLWFVDLVQEGGGVLGIALVGYVYVLESIGIRFLNLAGTSAGAINTMMMAAADSPEEAKAGKILSHLAALDLSKFQDGNWIIKSLTALYRFLLGKSGSQDNSLIVLVRRIFKILAFIALLPLSIAALIFLIIHLRSKLGLHPGDYFEHWLKEKLASFGIRNMADLNARMNDKLPEEIKAQSGEPCKLALVASDLTTQSKVVFPQDAAFYIPKEKLSEINPATYVRASMSVPIFFSPKTFQQVSATNDRKIDWVFRLRPKPKSEKDLITAFDAAGKKTWIEQQPIEIPETVQMVDGGVISNFPIDIFHVGHKIPVCPTFGVKLGLDHQKTEEPSDLGPLGVLATSFETARVARDADFIKGNPDFSQLVKEIETGPHHWLNFNLSDDAKRDLFRRGAEAAVEFLESFDWARYKESRKKKLFTVVKHVFDLDVAELIARANIFRNSPNINPKEIHRLEERLKLLKISDRPFRVLWVSDSIQGDEKEKEIIEAINGEIDQVNSSQAATECLVTERYDLIISDINREGNSKEGLQWFNSRIAAGLPQPPTIFYIMNLDLSRGVPPYAFGITRQPIELLHLVLDVVQRIP